MNKSDRLVYEVRVTLMSSTMLFQYSVGLFRTEIFEHAKITIDGHTQNSVG